MSWRLIYVLFLVILALAGASQVRSQTRASTADVPVLQVDANGKLYVHCIEHASLADLLAALRELEPGAVGVLGYVDVNGDVQALTASDLP